MEYPSGLCLIEGPSSLQSFGSGCTKPWIPVWTLVLHITLRSMGRLREWIRSLRVCWELVLCSTEWVGIRVYRTLTFHTTIATKRVLRWHRLRCYIVVAVEPPLLWNETGERQVFGPDILHDAERQVWMVRENLRIAQSRQKCYANHRWRELSFEVGGYVYLKVSPMRGLWCFNVRGKLAPRFIGSFKIMEKRGEVVYQLELPP
jgi:hypothetical protein